MNIAKLLTILLLCSLCVQAQQITSDDFAKKRRPTTTQRRTATSLPAAADQKTARYFESLRKSPAQQFAFLLKMPKGADLHSHLSGAVYAESYVQWAAENGLCVNNATLALSLPPCTAGQSAANGALTNSLLYRQMVDAWSM